MRQKKRTAAQFFDDVEMHGLKALEEDRLGIFALPFAQVEFAY